jgi:hypothetical protein
MCGVYLGIDEGGEYRMCKEDPKCCHKGKDPRTCSPEQIAECHPEKAMGEHPCEEDKGEDESKSDK